MNKIRRCFIVSVASAFAVLMVGCQANQQAMTSLSVAPGEYETAFDAALKASSDRGFDPTLRDRRRGIIETNAVISPSIFEPWKTDAATFDQLVENTASMQRRRIIWEFTPQTLPGATVATETGPDVLAMEPMPVDITTTASPVDLRVSVVIERAASPGTRPPRGRHGKHRARPSSIRPRARRSTACIGHPSRAIQFSNPPCWHRYRNGWGNPIER